MLCVYYRWWFWMLGLFILVYSFGWVGVDRQNRIVYTLTSIHQECWTCCIPRLLGQGRPSIQVPALFPNQSDIALTLTQPSSKSRVP